MYIFFLQGFEIINFFIHWSTFLCRFPAVPKSSRFPGTWTNGDVPGLRMVGSDTFGGDRVTWQFGVFVTFFGWWNRDPNSKVKLPQWMKRSRIELLCVSTKPKFQNKQFDSKLGDPVYPWTDQCTYPKRSNWLLTLDMHGKVARRSQLRSI